MSKPPKFLPCPNCRKEVCIGDRLDFESEHQCDNCEIWCRLNSEETPEGPRLWLENCLTPAPVTYQTWRLTEKVDGHSWGFWKADKFECCQICGFVRRADKTNKPCKGKARIDLR